MKVLLLHPGCLMYAEIYLRLEPLGLELVAAAARQGGHDVRIVDLQVQKPEEFFRELKDWRPDAVGFSLSYLANVPDVLDLAIHTRRMLPESFLFVGGHRASFIASELLAHAGEALDCVVRGEGEGIIVQLLETAENRRDQLHTLPGVVTRRGQGPQPLLLANPGALPPARDLLRRPKRYFLGPFDPCGSVEFSRGCPWDCTFCSAWTFYGRTYRRVGVEAAVENLARMPERGVFIVDDVAMLDPGHAEAIADEIERRKIRKEYYLETRTELVLRHPEVFRRWQGLGLRYMFLGLEAIDDEGMKRLRKRATIDNGLKAMEIARPAGDHGRGEHHRRSAVGSEAIRCHPPLGDVRAGDRPSHGRHAVSGHRDLARRAHRLTTRDYRLFDIQHAVLPTKLPLGQFYRELV